MRHTCLAVLIALCFGIGYAAQRLPAAVAGRVVTPARLSDEQDVIPQDQACNLVVDGEVTANVRVIAQRASTFDLELGVSSRDESIALATKGAYQTATWRDDGSLVSLGRPTATGVQAGRFAEKVSTPTGLADGFYRTQVVAILADQADRSAEASLYFEKTGGSARLLSQAEWRIRSNYMVASAHSTATQTPTEQEP